jgi:hypothetical protein
LFRSRWKRTPKGRLYVSHVINVIVTGTEIDTDEAVALLDSWARLLLEYVLKFLSILIPII